MVECNLGGCGMHLHLGIVAGEFENFSYNILERENLKKICFFKNPEHVVSTFFLPTQLFINFSSTQD